MDLVFGCHRSGHPHAAPRIAPSSSFHDYSCCRPHRVARSSMSVPVSQSSGSEGPPKVPIPRIQTRHYQQLPRRANPPYRDKVLIACTSCRERKVRCDGGQPRCRNCLDGIRTCVYLDSRRSRFKASVRSFQETEH